MRQAALCCLCLVLTSCAVEKTAGVLPEALAKAESGNEAMEIYYAKAAEGDGQGAQAAHDTAQSLFSEVVSLCRVLNPERLDTAADARQYGVVMELARHYDLAARGYERSFRLSKSIDVALLAARNWRRVGGDGIERAFGLLDDALKHGTDFGDGDNDVITAEIFTERGLLYHKQGLLKLAAEYYELALDRSHKTVEAILGDAVLGIRRGELRRGSDQIDTVRILTPEQSRFLADELAGAVQAVDDLRVPIGNQHHAYAKLLVRVGRNFEAMLAMEHAVMLDDTDYAMLNFLGGLLMQQNMPERAIAAYERSLALNPDQERTRGIVQQIQSQKR